MNLARLIFGFCFLCIPCFGAEPGSNAITTGTLLGEMADLARLAPRIAYHYARPGAVDDHRGLMPSDLRIAPLPKREPKALGGARGARFLWRPNCRCLNGNLPKATRSSVACRSRRTDALRFTSWQSTAPRELPFACCWMENH